jgi:acetyltransferase-like isoleucine patch superfamily enzyme
VTLRSTARGLRVLARERVDALAARAYARLTESADRSRMRNYRALSEISEAALLFPETRIENHRGQRGAIRIGAHSAVRGELMTLGHGGQIEIGDWCYVGSSSRMWSADRIKIGNRVLISHVCEIHDWNAHPLDARARHRHFRDILTSGHPLQLTDVRSAPVILEDDVWIGFGSTVLKGVTIGRGSIVAARSLVTEDVPPGVLVTGSPARITRELPPEMWAPEK